jgi:hypothetical protein
MCGVSFVSVDAARVALMLSTPHEVLVEMFRDRPLLAAYLLSDPLGMPVPAFQHARVSSGDLTNVSPTEYRADAVITLTHEEVPVLAVVVEVQLRPERRKRFAWPAYVATLHARLECPVHLLVMCPDQAVAASCAVPIQMGDPWVLILRPQVVGLKDVPVVTDPALARRQPEMAVLSAVAHGERSGQQGVFDALLAALEVVDHDHAKLYADFVLAALPEAVRHSLEDFMTTTSHRYQSDFARRYYAEGEAKGKAEGVAEGKAEGVAEGKAEGEAMAVLAFLDARGIEVPDPVREDITSCTDLDQLDTWIRRAATATKVQELFD